MKVIGYGRVSTEEQAVDGHGLGSQREIVAAYCKAKGWDMTWRQDVASGKTRSSRPELVSSLIELQRHAFGGIVVAKLDRLTRSVRDFADILESSNGEKWSIVALDLNIDTTTATGRMMAGFMALLSQWEREVIGERTRAGLAEARRKGVRLGRRDYFVHPDTKKLITELRAGGKSLEAIAESLNSLGIKSPGGKTWTINTVWRELRKMAPQDTAA